MRKQAPQHGHALFWPQTRELISGIHFKAESVVINPNKWKLLRGSLGPNTRTVTELLQRTCVPPSKPSGRLLSCVSGFLGAETRLPAEALSLFCLFSWGKKGQQAS